MQTPDGGTGMRTMPLMAHLEELRARILRALAGAAAAFALSLSFSDALWFAVKQPGLAALKSLGYPGQLVQIVPMEAVNILWFELPLFCAIFLASPWVLYQVWAFVAPGLYPEERRWAAPFILSSAGLFAAGGLFGYFVVFRYGLTFLLGIGQGKDIATYVSLTEYFDLFVKVVLGVAVIFELPVLVFFLVLLRITTPRFLLGHSRYAILIIFAVAAIVTPTSDAANLAMLSVPMCLLFYVGIFAGYLLVLHREGRRFPWLKTGMVLLGVLLPIAAGLYLAAARYHWKLAPHWPFLTR